MGTITRRRPVQLSAQLAAAVAVPALSAVSLAADVAVLTGVPTGVPGAFGPIALGFCGHNRSQFQQNFLKDLVVLAASQTALGIGGHEDGGT